MAKLLGKELPVEGTIYEALMSLPGITGIKAKKALRLAGISPNRRVDEVKEKELAKIDEHIEAPVGKATHLRISPRKVNFVMKEIRGRNVNEALNILKYTPKKAARMIEKVLKNAVGNATNTYELDADNLYIQKALVEGGFTLKRISPGPMGRAFRIRKRTSHIKIVLKERKEENR